MNVAPRDDPGRLVIRAAALIALITGCSSPFDSACQPSATRLGWRVTYVSATCDTTVAWITPPPPAPERRSEP